MTGTHRGDRQRQETAISQRKGRHRAGPMHVRTCREYRKRITERQKERNPQRQGDTHTHTHTHTHSLTLSRERKGRICELKLRELREKSLRGLLNPHRWFPFSSPPPPRPVILFLLPAAQSTWGHTVPCPPSTGVCKRWGTQGAYESQPKPGLLGAGAL